MDNKGYKNALLVSEIVFGKEKPTAPLQGCAASRAQSKLNRASIQVLSNPIYPKESPGTSFTICKQAHSGMSTLNVKKAYRG